VLTGAVARRACAQGVLTLAFEGFPPALAELKARRARECRAVARAHTFVLTRLTSFPPGKQQRALAAHHGATLPAENPGSRWPKSTLGALRDGARLTPAQLATLHAVCTKHSARLAAAQPIAVGTLSLTLFACRSLERTLAAAPLPLALPPDASRADADARAAASATLSEFDAAKLDAYWFHASRDGSRESHYRGAASGATLVAPLPACALEACGVAAFRAAVNDALPGLWAWFDDASLHVTVRGLL
jgi:hypothetical protein